MFVYEQVQILKGAMRETEADRMWALRGVHPSKVQRASKKIINT